MTDSSFTKETIYAELILNGKCIDLDSILAVTPRIVVIQLQQPLNHPIVAGAALPQELLVALEHLKMDPSSTTSTAP